MDASTPRNNFARREAQPIPWDKLSKDQQDAITQAAGILGDLANAPVTREDGKTSREAHLDLFLPPIDAERLNHVILLDGDRGSGKTAVLVTLLDAWNRMLRGRADKLHQDFLTALTDTDHVVPIGLIDLQPLPKSTNLLLYLVGRFQRVVEAIEQVHTERGQHSKRATDRRHPWQGVSPDEPASTAKWRDFVHAAALGWNGDLGQRRGSLDPEAFVVELEQTERRRLDIVSSFRELIDALVKDYERLDAQPKKNPLFLLAIDDADTNPEKAEELLDLVRTLWHPRVAFLLTGDSNLFLALLRKRAMKSLADSKDDGVVNFANDLACDIYNKAIPPAHRCRFPRLAPRVRLERMHELLKQLPYDKTKETAQFAWLSNLFESNEQLQEALPARERSLADLKVRIQLELSPRTNNRNPLHEVIAALCRSEFTPWREKPSEHVSHYGAEEELLQAARATRNWDWTASRKNTLFLRNDEGWNLVVQKTPRWEATDRQDKRPVSEDKLATGMLARDIVARDLWHREALPRLEPMGLLGLVVQVEYQADGEVYSFAWPLPDWPSFADYFAFGRDWKNHVSVPERSQTNNVDLLARRFIEIVVCCARGTPPGTTEPPEWDRLASDIVAIAKTNSAQARWALSRAGLLAAPESGLGNEAANQLLDALKEAFGTKWEQARNALRRERRARTRLAHEPAGERAASSILPTIDATFRGHRWHRVVEQDPVKPIKPKLTVKPIIEAVANIRTTWSTTRPEVGAYFNMPSRLGKFHNEINEERLHEFLSVLTQFRGQDGGAAQAILTLWQIECRLSNEPVLDIALRDGRPYVPLIELNAMPKTLRTGLSFDRNVMWSVEWSLQAAGINDFSSFRGVLFRVLCDMMVDATEAANASSAGPISRPPYWPGLGTDGQEHFEGYQWPVPAWPGCYEWEVLAHQWNDLVYEVSHIIHGNKAQDHRLLVDGLAYWLILSVTAIFRGEELRASLRTDLDHPTFLQGARFAHAARPKDPVTARQRAFAAWCDNLHLFAAPESGLSKPIATYLLNNYPAGGDIRPRKAELFAARAQRARASGIPENQIHRELASIDSANPDHPWVQKFGPHTTP